MIKERGFQLTFYIYWIWHIAILLIMINEWNFNPRLIMSLNLLSYGFLGVGTMLTFTPYLEDCNTKYLSSCVFSFCLRTLILFMNFWGFSNSRYTLLLCGFSMLLFYFIRGLDRRERRTYRNNI